MDAPGYYVQGVSHIFLFCYMRLKDVDNFCTVIFFRLINLYIKYIFVL